MSGTMTWLPIEQAPKDGTEVLIFVKWVEGETEKRVARYNSFEEGKTGPNRPYGPFVWDNGEGGIAESLVTHFAYLPPDPI